MRCNLYPLHRKRQESDESGNHRKEGKPLKSLRIKVLREWLYCGSRYEIIILHLKETGSRGRSSHLRAFERRFRSSHRIFLLHSLLLLNLLIFTPAFLCIPGNTLFHVACLVWCLVTRETLMTAKKRVLEDKLDKNIQEKKESEKETFHFAWNDHREWRCLLCRRWL